MKVIGNLHILGQRSIIKFNTNPAANHEYSGWVSEDNVRENVLFGQVLYFNTTQQGWMLAKADSEDTMPARAIALEDINPSKPGLILRFGTVRLDSKNFTSPFIYVSEDNAGELSINKPSKIGSFIQQIGTPVKNNVAWFDFNSTMIEVE